MRVTVTEEDINGLRIDRYTATVNPLGYMRLSRYDLLMRDTKRSQFRIKQVWDESSPRGQRITQEGVVFVDRPDLSWLLKKLLLKAAREQIEWLKEE